MQPGRPWAAPPPNSWLWAGVVLLKPVLVVNGIVRVDVPVFVASQLAIQVSLCSIRGGNIGLLFRRCDQFWKRQINTDAPPLQSDEPGGFGNVPRRPGS